MQSELKVSDVYQAAYLVASGCAFPNVEFEGTWAKFIFPDDDGAVSWYVEAYRLDHSLDGGELVVPVKWFIHAIRRLKSAMAEAQRQQKGSYANGTKTINGARDSQTRNAIRQTNNQRV